MVSRQNTSKIDGITFCAGAHIWQGSRRLILNLTWSDLPTSVSHKFYLLTILKYKKTTTKTTTTTTTTTTTKIRKGKKRKKKAQKTSAHTIC